MFLSLLDDSYARSLGHLSELMVKASKLAKKAAAPTQFSAVATAGVLDDVGIEEILGPRCGRRVWEERGKIVESTGELVLRIPIALWEDEAAGIYRERADGVDGLGGADGGEVEAVSLRVERPAKAEGQPRAVLEMSVAEIDALADAVEAEFDITADATLFKAMCTVSIEDDCGAAFTAILPNFKLRERLLPFEYTSCVANLVAKAYLKQRAEDGGKGEALKDRTAFIGRFLRAITSVEAEGT
jgi:hypothetical protein